VPTEALPRLFERLFRVESSRNRQLGGSGLGLAISRSVVEAHGGVIVARASTLGGLWVEVRLPLSGEGA
jgi:two-component system sensor histidine kinase BaeS